MHDGDTYSPRWDKARLSGNTRKVLAVFLEHRGVWMAKRKISELAGLHPYAEVRARFADLRKVKWGAWPMESQRSAHPSLWEYRMAPENDPAREAHLRNIVKRVLGDPTLRREGYAADSDSPVTLTETS